MFEDLIAAESRDASKIESLAKLVILHLRGTLFQEPVPG
jgi:hypothetical protein